MKDLRGLTGRSCALRFTGDSARAFLYLVAILFPGTGDYVYRLFQLIHAPGSLALVISCSCSLAASDACLSMLIGVSATPSVRSFPPQLHPRLPVLPGLRSVGFSCSAGEGKNAPAARRKASGGAC